MGYAVWPSGRLHLPESDDAAAVAAVKAAWATVPGVIRVSDLGRLGAGVSGAGGGVDETAWIEAFPPCDTIADIAWAAAASVTRDGDWLEFAHDEVGDPKWARRATAFYVAIAPFVRSGTVQFVGEANERWSYSYADGKITQLGLNGWDSSVVIGTTVTALSYEVRCSGRLHLPKSRDGAAVAAVRAACAEHSGCFHPDMVPAGAALVDVGWAGAAWITRKRDWIDFGQPKRSDAPPSMWSDQATAFYIAIAPYVHSGLLQIRGEDGADWAYSYADGKITQQGRNGWDGSVEPFGESG